MSLGAVQQEAPDSLRIHLDVAWVGLRVGGGRVLGNPLGGATSVIQFDGVSAVAVLSLHTEVGGRTQQRNSGYCWHFSLGENLALVLILTTLCPPVSP